MNIVLSFLVLLSCTLIACGEDPVSNTLPTGEIWGRVEVIDPSGNDLTDRSGVTVSLEGTSLSGVSDADGTWSIKNVPQGIYSVRVAKPGHSYNRIFNVQFVGNGQFYLNSLPSLARIYLQPFPSFTIQQQTAVPEPDKPNHFRLSITLSDTIPSASDIRCFYKIDPDAPFSYVLSRTLNPVTGKEIDNRRYEIVVSLAGLGLPSGTTVYLQTVPLGGVPGTSYYDIFSRETVFTAVNENGASEVAAVTIE